MGFFHRKGKTFNADIFSYLFLELSIAFIYLSVTDRHGDRRSTFWPLQTVTVSNVNYLHYSLWDVLPRFFPALLVGLFKLVGPLG